MAQRGRWGLSYSQKRDLWIRWKQGQPISEIARALEKNHGSIHYVISLHGGIVPVERRRSRLALSLPRAEAAEIARRPLPQSLEQLLPAASPNAGQGLFISRRTTP